MLRRVTHAQGVCLGRFAVAAPALWNTLPLNVENSPSVAIFKQRAETLLFKEVFYFKKSYMYN